MVFFCWERMYIPEETNRKSRGRSGEDDQPQKLVCVLRDQLTVTCGEMQWAREWARKQRSASAQGIPTRARLIGSSWSRVTLAHIFTTTTTTLNYGWHHHHIYYKTYCSEHSSHSPHDLVLPACGLRLQLDLPTLGIYFSSVTLGYFIDPSSTDHVDWGPMFVLQPLSPKAYGCITTFYFLKAGCLVMHLNI